MRTRAGVLFIIVIALLIINLPGESSAVCVGTPMNPLLDVCWWCMFPVSIGGVGLLDIGILKPPLHMEIVPPVCVCPKPPLIIVGLSVGFFEPARLIETVKDPFCFPILGVGLSNPAQGFLGGTHVQRSDNDGDQEHVFQQAHWYIYPIFGLLDLFTDFPCLEGVPFDIAYLTEVDPLWNDDLLGFVINPEAMLFANPIAQLSCVADAILSNLGDPINTLFWCMGSWGSAYPLTGHVNSDNYVQGNAAIAARMIYKLSRELLLWDTGTYVCSPIPLPIWQKDHYRIHIVKPVRDFMCHPIGRSSLIWGTLKNPPFSISGSAGDNFAWMLFRKRICCVGLPLP